MGAPLHRSVPVLVAAAGLALVAAACGNGGGPASASAGSGSTSGGGRAAASARGSGPVDVLYAGSLVTLMQTFVDAGFHEATGYTVTGIAGGSTALAGEIKGGVHVADVFVSASPKGDRALEGNANGNWVTWYSTFATSPLLLGYDRSSKFAATLRSKPWWKVVTEPGIQVGRTNPVTDPKGVLVVRAVDETEKREHDPALGALVNTTTNVFPEQTLVGRLQAGQLDAGFFYGVEAAAAKLPTVRLTGASLAATFTITVVSHAPHPAAAAAFVRYLLGATGRKLLQENGMQELRSPKLTGRPSQVPGAVRGVVGA